MAEIRNNPFYSRFREKVKSLGGMLNAHLHLDRAGTLDDKYFQTADHEIHHSFHISLSKKHSLINSIHEGPAYDEHDLVSRVNQTLDVMVDCNTTRADTMVDVTADRVGLSALETLSRIKRERAHEIDLRLASYTPLGFKDSDPARWEVFMAGVEQADFIGCLPEADDVDDYPDHIGFEKHCRLMLELGHAQKKMIHVHTDQRNEPTENGTERLIEVVREEGVLADDNGEPLVWAVHMISPSTYDEVRFQKMVDGLLECNIGVICCPSAALGMRQIRPLKTPTYNSIPRVLELVRDGVHVRLASDNIADICSPTTTADLTDEVFVLSAALRYYQVDILAKLAAGIKPDDAERRMIDDHLKNDAAHIDRLMAAIKARTV